MTLLGHKYDNNSCPTCGSKMHYIWFSKWSEVSYRCEGNEQHRWKESELDAEMRRRASGLRLPSLERDPLLEPMLNPADWSPFAGSLIYNPKKKNPYKVVFGVDPYYQDDNQS
jgi:hypothetical protein